MLVRPTHRSKLLVPGGKLDDLALLHCEWALGLERFAMLRESRLAAGISSDARAADQVGEHGDRWLFRFALPTEFGMRTNAVRISGTSDGAVVEHLVIDEDNRRQPEPSADSPETTRVILEMPGMQPAMLRGVAPVVLSEREVPALVADALEPNREAPIVLISVDNTTREPLVDPPELARRLAGMARVVSLSTVIASRRLKDELVGRGFSEKFGCFHGGVRILWPGIHKGDDPYDHLLLLPVRLYPIPEGMRAERIAGLFCEMIAEDEDLRARLREVEAPSRPEPLRQAPPVDRWSPRSLIVPGPGPKTAPAEPPSKAAPPVSPWRSPLAPRVTRSTVSTSPTPPVPPPATQTTVTRIPPSSTSEATALPIPAPPGAPLSAPEPLLGPSPAKSAASAGPGSPSTTSATFTQHDVVEREPERAKSDVGPPEVEARQPDAAESRQSDPVVPRRPREAATTWSQLASDVVAAAELAEELEQDLDATRRELMDARKALRRAEQERDEAVEARFVARSVLEALRLAEACFPDRLVVLPSALASADDSPYRNPERVFESLTLLAFFGRQDGDCEAAFQKVTGAGARWKPKDSPETTSRFGPQRTWADSEGQRKLFRRHITLGHGVDAQRCAQIYYDVASDGRIEIAWVGEHRPTVSEDT